MARKWEKCESTCLSSDNFFFTSVVLYSEHSGVTFPLACCYISYILIFFFWKYALLAAMVVPCYKLDKWSRIQWLITCYVAIWSWKLTFRAANDSGFWKIEDLVLAHFRNIELKPWAHWAGMLSSARIGSGRVDRSLWSVPFWIFWTVDPLNFFHLYDDSCPWISNFFSILSFVGVIGAIVLRLWPQKIQKELMEKAYMMLIAMLSTALWLKPNWELIGYWWVLKWIAAIQLMMVGDSMSN